MIDKTLEVKRCYFNCLTLNLEQLIIKTLFCWFTENFKNYKQLTQTTGSEAAVCYR